MRIENDTIIIDSSYDLDHIFSGIGHKKTLDLKRIELIKSQFLFELELNNIKPSEELFEKKIKIIKNKKEENFPNEFENFGFLLKEMLIEKNNPNIFPYYGIDI